MGPGAGRGRPSNLRHTPAPEITLISLSVIGTNNATRAVRKNGPDDFVDV